MAGTGADTEQIEALRSWWRKNGRWVVTGLVIAAIIVGGWKLWDYWQNRQASAAASAYAAVVLAEQKNNFPRVVKTAHAVLSQYPDSAYGALAGLALAKAQFLQRHYDKASRALIRVINHAPDRGIASIARLRLARVQLQQGNPQAALKTVAGQRIADAFRVSALTVRGKALLALGRVAEARSAWQAAQAMNAPGSARYRLLAMRLAGLPAATTRLPETSAAKTPAARSAAGARLTLSAGAASGDAAP